MAIDSEDKRRSTQPGILPVADNAIDRSDRPHVLGIYRGITVANRTIMTGRSLSTGANALISGRTL